MTESTHDEIQLLLLDEKQRQSLCKSQTGKIIFEKRIKPQFEPEIFLDAIEFWVGENQYWDYIRIWEIKPTLNDLGQTLRQLNKYQEIVNQYYAFNSTPYGEKGKVKQVMLLYSYSKYSFEVLCQYFENGGITVLAINESQKSSNGENKQ